MTVNFTEPTYVMIIMEAGVIDTLIADTKLSRLMDKTFELIHDYLDLNGYREEPACTPTTEDGFAQIYRTVWGEEHASSVLWTYIFDGEMTLEAAREVLESVHQQELIVP